MPLQESNNLKNFTLSVVLVSLDLANYVPQDGGECNHVVHMFFRQHAFCPFPVLLDIAKLRNNQNSREKFFAKHLLYGLHGGLASEVEIIVLKHPNGESILMPAFDLYGRTLDAVKFFDILDDNLAGRCVIPRLGVVNKQVYVAGWASFLPN